MRVKGKKYGVRTSQTIKYRDFCKYCTQRFPSCICWKQENDVYMHQGEPEVKFFERDSALMKRQTYTHKQEMEKERQELMSEDEIEPMTKPVFDRRTHKPHLRIENYKKRRAQKIKVKTDFRRNIKSELL